jgi:hypothetical protein
MDTKEQAKQYSSWIIMLPLDTTFILKQAQTIICGRKSWLKVLMKPSIFSSQEQRGALHMENNTLHIQFSSIDDLAKETKEILKKQAFLFSKQSYRRNTPEDLEQARKLLQAKKK